MAFLCLLFLGKTLIAPFLLVIKSIIGETVVLTTMLTLGTMQTEGMQRLLVCSDAPHAIQQLSQH